MKLEIKEIDGVPVTGIPDGSRTDYQPRSKGDNTFGTHTLKEE